MEATVALFAVVFAALAANNALAERNAREHAQALAQEAAQPAVKADGTKVAAKRPQRVEAPTLRKNVQRADAERPCVIRPVMSDGQIEQCRVLYRYESPGRRDQ